MKAETPEALPVTEQENPNTRNLSSLSAAEIVQTMNREDDLVAFLQAVEESDMAGRFRRQRLEQHDCAFRYAVGRVAGAQEQLGVTPALPVRCP